MRAAGGHAHDVAVPPPQALPQTRRRAAACQRGGRRTPDGRPRDRAATERILAAVGTVLARDGFGAVGVNAIAREAGVDKVLIYRYFGGLPELLQSWGASGRFWPSIDELLGPHPRLLLALPAAERLAAFFERFIDALRARPLTIEILAAETVQRNELTAILDSERQEWGNRGGGCWAARRRGGSARTCKACCCCGSPACRYLLVRARTSRIIGGFDLHSDAGWQELKDSVHISAQQRCLRRPPSGGAAHRQVGTGASIPLTCSGGMASSRKASPSSHCTADVTRISTPCVRVSDCTRAARLTVRPTKPYSRRSREPIMPASPGHGECRCPAPAAARPSRASSSL